jgi:hypothetical protein
MHAVPVQLVPLLILYSMHGKRNGERERDDALRWAPFPRGSVAPSVCRRFRFPPLLSRGCYSTTFYDGARGPNQCALHKNTGMQPTKVVTNEDS